MFFLKKFGTNTQTTLGSQFINTLFLYDVTLTSSEIQMTPNFDATIPQYRHICMRVLAFLRLHSSEIFVLEEEQ